MSPSSLWATFASPVSTHPSRELRRAQQPVNPHPPFSRPGSERGCTRSRDVARRGCTSAQLRPRLPAVHSRRGQSVGKGISLNTQNVFKAAFTLRSVRTTSLLCLRGPAQPQVSHHTISPGCDCHFPAILWARWWVGAERAQTQVTQPRSLPTSAQAGAGGGCSKARS